MRVVEESEDRLVLRDTQLDKKLGVSILAVFFLAIAFIFAEGGDWMVASVPIALAAGAMVYLKLTLLSLVVTFDRATDRVTLSVTGRKGSEEWVWKLSELEGAEVSESSGSASGGSGRKRPVIILKDGTRVPIRPYHSAGAQSWSAIIAIRRFIGQEKTDDLPVGWISDD